MIRLVTLLWLVAGLSAFGQTAVYTEFYCNEAGTNVNAGSTTNAVATYGCSNANWTTPNFTPNDGSTAASFVNVGDWASVCLDATTNSVFIARVASVAAGANGAIGLSTTAATGTAPADGATGRSIRVGGAWRGVFKQANFPFTFVANSLTNVSGCPVRVNFQSGYSNIPTVTINHTLPGPVTFQGYTQTAGDGGKALMDYGAGNLKFTLGSGANGILVRDFIFQHNANGNDCVTASASLGNIFWGCVFRNNGGIGLNLSSGMAVECEAYGCNSANTTLTGAFRGAASTFIRCFAHHNTTANSHGFHMAGNCGLFNCLSVSNGASGFLYTIVSATAAATISGCDAIGNGTNGLHLEATGPAEQSIYVENCNFLANQGYGIYSTNGGFRIGGSVSNYFGTGTMTNLLGNYSPNFGATNGLWLSDLHLYAADVTPYVNLAGGNFTITNTSAAYGAGRGTITDLRVAGGTISQPNVGSTYYTNASTTVTNTVTNTVTISVGGAAGSHVFMQ